MAINPVVLAQDLIRCESVTPVEGGALDLLQRALEGLGFVCHRLPFSAPDTPDVDNLFAKWGTGSPHFCFAGHTDVVPEGDRSQWRADPFEARIDDDWLIGRGAADMKGAIAAFVAAAADLIETAPPGGALSLMITGDEEGPAINGTVKILKWLEDRGEKIDLCRVGEPTNPAELGDMIKIGRRGSVNGTLTITGKQGHVAYPHLADNPLPRLARVAAHLAQIKLDDGTTHFQPSNLELTTIDTGNEATNVIPAAGRLRLNIRFNDLQTGAGLEQKIRAEIETECPADQYDLDWVISGEAFYTAPGALSDRVADAAEKVTGRRPELSTTGGTSDARFIRSHCPVVEFGLISQTMHKIDERVRTGDIKALTTIYREILAQTFS